MVPVRILLFLAIILFPALSFADDPSGIRSMIGREVPLFILRDARNNRYNLREHLGKVILVNYFYVGCAPCKRELPVLDRIRKAFPEPDFELVAVNGKGQKPEEITRFLDEIGAPGVTAVIDSLGTQVRRFGVNMFPASFLVNRKGVIVEAFAGLPLGFEERLKKRIGELISQ